MHKIKLLVIGPSGSGKTKFIKSLDGMNGMELKDAVPNQGQVVNPTYTLANDTIRYEIFRLHNKLTIESRDLVYSGNQQPIYDVIIVCFSGDQLSVINSNIRVDGKKKQFKIDPQCVAGIRYSDVLKIKELASVPKILLITKSDNPQNFLETPNVLQLFNGVFGYVQKYSANRVIGSDNDPACRNILYMKIKVLVDNIINAKKQKTLAEEQERQIQQQLDAEQKRHSSGSVCGIDSSDGSDGDKHASQKDLQATGAGWFDVNDAGGKGNGANESSALLMAHARGYGDTVSTGTTRTMSTVGGRAEYDDESEHFCSCRIC